MLLSSLLINIRKVSMLDVKQPCNMQLHKIKTVQLSEDKTQRQYRASQVSNGLLKSESRDTVPSCFQLKELKGKIVKFATFKCFMCKLQNIFLSTMFSISRTCSYE